MPYKPRRAAYLLRSEHFLNIAREHGDTTRADISRRTGLHKSVVNRALNEENELSLPTALCLSRHYRIPVEELVELHAPDEVDNRGEEAA